MAYWRRNPKHCSLGNVCRPAPATAASMSPQAQEYFAHKAAHGCSLPDIFASPPSTEQGSRHHSPAKSVRRIPSHPPTALTTVSCTPGHPLNPHCTSVSIGESQELVDPDLCPLRASVVTMAASRASVASSWREPSTAALDAEPAPEGPWIRPSPATSPGGIGGGSGSPGTRTDSFRSATDRGASLRLAGVQSATASPEPGLPPRPPLHRKAMSMSAVPPRGDLAAWPDTVGRVGDMHGAELSAAQSGVRSTSPIKPAVRLRSQLESGDPLMLHSSFLHSLVLSASLKTAELAR